MELSAPFLAAYWPYIASVLVGFIIAQFLLRISQPAKDNYKVDVDPLQDSSSDAITQDNPKPSGEAEADHIPYPWFDDRLSEDEMRKASAEFYEKMNHRRTVRQISEEDVPIEVLENIIKTAG